MKKYPIIQQHDSMDCGPTCLAMVCRYYGKYYELDRLRNMCNITNEGVSLYGISVAAEMIGFKTVGTQLTLYELSESKQLPCIIYWNQNHFVVLYRIKEKSKGLVFFIANPATGIGTEFTENEFSECFLNSINNQGKGTGIALFLSPTNSFWEKKVKIKYKGANKHTLIFLYSYIISYKKQYIQLLFVTIAGTGLQMILPFLTQVMVDKGIDGKNISIIVIVLVGQMIIEIGATTMGFMRNWILLRTGTKINISMISDYIAKLLHIPISFFEKKRNGDIIQRINDHTRIQRFLTDSSLDAFFSITSIMVLGVVIFIYNWMVALIFLGCSVLYVYWVWMFMNKRAILDNKTFSQNAISQNNIMQLITGMQEIKLNGCERNKQWEWERIQHRIFLLSMKSLKLSQYQQFGGLFINKTKNLIITGFVATLVVRHEITLGMMISIQYIVGTLNSPVEQIINFIRQFQDAKLSTDRLQDIYKIDNEDNEEKKDVTDAKCGDIIMESVSFKYNKNETKSNIDGISVQIPKGKTTAIVGLSGSGKSTLLKLILGFYHPDAGKIYVGNQTLNDINLREWRQKCGVVMQDGFVFSDTIIRNIAPNAINVDMERVKVAAKIANIDDFIEKLPLKYNTLIGNNGHGLSLGQKQRILIARAVYKNPQYILLDEATNSLDAKNEYIIMQNLNNFIKGRTAIVIAHRLSTVKNADNIIVLEDGKIHEQGSHSKLISLKGLYYNLVKEQLYI